MTVWFWKSMMIVISDTMCIKGLILINFPLNPNSKQKSLVLCCFPHNGRFIPKLTGLHPLNLLRMNIQPTAFNEHAYSEFHTDLTAPRTKTCHGSVCVQRHRFKSTNIAFTLEPVSDANAIGFWWCRRIEGVIRLSYLLYIILLLLQADLLRDSAHKCHLTVQFCSVVRFKLFIMHSDATYEWF